MLTADERETFALQVMEEVRRWTGVEMRPHASPHEAGSSDGVEFRLSGRQIGHIHSDCAVHLSLTKGLRASVIQENLAEPLPVAPNSTWAMYNPARLEDAVHVIWLLRLNYIRLRRQRLTPLAAASSALLQKHEAALGSVSSTVSVLLQQTQIRGKPRPLPSLDIHVETQSGLSA
ncbi:MAG: luciferase family protein [Gemmatimonadaceae bacterium]